VRHHSKYHQACRGPKARQLEFAAQGLKCQARDHKRRNHICIPTRIRPVLRLLYEGGSIACDKSQAFWPTTRPLRAFNIARLPEPLIFRQACVMDLEGIVSKRLTAPYRRGLRGID
jgi:hypothetical protein